MTPGELEEHKAFVDKNLTRGFIHSTSLVANSWEKKDSSLRLDVDYQGLNGIWVQNV